MHQAGAWGSLTVVYFTDAFNVPDRQLQSAEHTVSACQQADAL